MDRLGDPETDIGPAVVFLASEGARYITGQTLAVDGGHCLRRGPDFRSYVEQRFDAEALDPTRATR